jgi:hypothetical protein
VFTCAHLQCSLLLVSGMHCPSVAGMHYPQYVLISTNILYLLSMILLLGQHLVAMTALPQHVGVPWKHHLVCCPHREHVVQHSTNRTCMHPILPGMSSAEPLLDLKKHYTACALELLSDLHAVSLDCILAVNCSVYSLQR